MSLYLVAHFFHLFIFLSINSPRFYFLLLLLFRAAHLTRWPRWQPQRIAPSTPSRDSYHGTTMSQWTNCLCAEPPRLCSTSPPLTILFSPFLFTLAAARRITHWATTMWQCTLSWRRRGLSWSGSFPIQSFQQLTKKVRVELVVLVCVSFSFLFFSSAFEIIFLHIVNFAPPFQCCVRYAAFILHPFSLLSECCSPSRMRRTLCSSLICSADNIVPSPPSQNIF